MVSGSGFVTRICLSPGSAAGPPPEEPGGTARTISLPEPETRGNSSLEEALRARRSVRSYAARPLTLKEVSQLLWAAQGITGSGGGRTVPSAGALFPLEVYLVAGKVEGVPAGVYKYGPRRHDLSGVLSGDLRDALASAAFGQSWAAAAPAVIAFAAVHERTTAEYGGRGKMYVRMEVGSAFQNVHLQAVALRLGTVVIGAFDDDKVGEVLRLPPNEKALGLMPVGAER
jgi:SagB-type dehydrogenase family enzyme